MNPQFENVPRNPVGRLHRILLALPDPNRHNSQTMGQWLIKHFNVADSTTATEMELYADLAHLVVAAQKTVNELPNYEPEDLRAFREPIERVATVVSSNNPQSHSYSFRGQISAETLKGLEFYSRILTRETPEITLAADVLQKLLADVQSLMAEVLNSDLDAKLKAILMEHLSAVERALRLYAISGSAGLRRAANGLAGATMFGYVENTVATSVGLIKKCAYVAAIIASLTGFVANARTAYPELLEHLPEITHILER